MLVHEKPSSVRKAIFAFSAIIVGLINIFRTQLVKFYTWYSRYQVANVQSAVESAVAPKMDSRVLWSTRELCTQNKKYISTNITSTPEEYENQYVTFDSSAQQLQRGSWDQQNHRCARTGNISCSQGQGKADVININNVGKYIITPLLRQTPC